MASVDSYGKMAVKFFVTNLEMGTDYPTPNATVALYNLTFTPPYLWASLCSIMPSKRLHLVLDLPQG